MATLATCTGLGHINQLEQQHHRCSRAPMDRGQHELHTAACSCVAQTLGGLLATSSSRVPRPKTTVHMLNAYNDMSVMLLSCGHGRALAGRPSPVTVHHIAPAASPLASGTTSNLKVFNADSSMWKPSADNQQPPYSHTPRNSACIPVSGTEAMQAAAAGSWQEPWVSPCAHASRACQHSYY